MGSNELNMEAAELLSEEGSEQVDMQCLLMSGGIFSKILLAFFFF